ncbi:polysaccharide lyase family 8 super-sandwich domain-containing protein [Kribbella sp. CA-293567]|uniref:polysaccharide lyase family 8 super-sandwich domain-containing protein n=1 Tax=Kribbella sp. CA-293567 TaxID=3002436 RepID=UPI0022DE7331|nr:polysaccharide lyase family 8 super-sandwich domain-containing protein [Kribbella sp. CA-293567]WBQ05765.1 polysaccharide lyase beta-sandwich domain-containing protein [Kribbella sp. CA-293567]
MQITRRRLLSFVPAAALLTAVHPAAAATATTASEAPRLLDNLVAIFAGTPESNARPEVRAKLATLDQTARTWLAALDRAHPGELFAGLPLGTSDPNLSASYQHLYEIALATRRPGPASELQGNLAVQARVLDKLRWLHANYYGDQSKGYYGNWFTWEIGISGYVGKTLALLAAPADLVSLYVASMDAYLRNGKDGDVDLESRFHTGANLVDLTANRIIQGALLGDDARIRKALQDQFTVFATIDPYRLQHGVTDGYYADGSFIQHDSVAYTGSYGKALLTRVVQTVKTLDGTGYASGGDLVKVVQGWVEHGFAPLVFEGWMMEIVKGRAISRPATGYDDVAAVIEAIVDLAGYATAADAATLRGYVKFTARPTLNPNSFVSPVSIARFADIVADSTIRPVDLNPAASSIAFNSMDRTVHRRPGYAFALARSSERISKYEYMSGENLMPWFQGDGAYYLYLSGQNQTQAYGVDYLTTVSPYRLAGVTAPLEQRKSIPELYGTAYYNRPPEFTASSELQNKYVYFPVGTNQYSGGATLGAYGAAGWIQSDDRAYADRDQLPADFVTYRNAQSTKSWFLLDDEIVVLAAGISDQADRSVTTCIDARIAAPTDAVQVTGVLRNGRAWSSTTGTGDLNWLRYANTTAGTSVGYYFLQPSPVAVNLEQVTRSRRTIRTANPDTAVTKQVFTVTHETQRRASLAYALIPHATEAALRSYRHGRLLLLSNTPRLQAIHHPALSLTAANTFAPGRHQVLNFTIDGPASFLTQRRAGTTIIAVADPTTTRSIVTVSVLGRRLTKLTGDPGITVQHTLTGTRLTYDTHQTYGRTVTGTFRG